MMIDINFSGEKIFEFKDSSIIQITGLNEELKRLIVDIYMKIFSGYKFSDVDMEAMNGYYPEIKDEGKILKKDDITVIKLSSIEDIVEQLQVKNDSILFKYLLSLGNELSTIKAINKVEESLIELCIGLDELIKNKISMENLSVMTNVYGIEFKKIIKSFINIDFIELSNQRKPLWLLKHKELIDLFLNTIKLIIEKDNNVIVIIDGLDVKIELGVYNYLIGKLYELTEEHSNFKIWLIPKTENGIRLDYKIFENTYILNESIVPMGDFDSTYESICRNYPDNNLPTKMQVLRTLLRLFSFHHSDKLYRLSKETVILQIFLKLLDEEPIKLENTELSNLETNFLTSFKR